MRQLATGHALDAIAEEANLLLVQANGALLNDDSEEAINAITSFAERVFAIPPFTPDPWPQNWRDILRCWMLGQPIAGIAAGQESDTLRFVEGALIYRLPWAMDAVRVRAEANGDLVSDDDGFFLRFEDFELGLAVPAVETGTVNRSASILIQAGFNSRLAAVKAVNDTGALFTNSRGLKDWLKSDEVQAFSLQRNWPTEETRAIWNEFLKSFTPIEDRTWSERRYWVNVAWYNAPPPSGTAVRLYRWNNETLVLAGDGIPLGFSEAPLNNAHQGLIHATTSIQHGRVDLKYLGPDDLWIN